MTEITLYADEYAIKVKGHANYDEKGKDIVCAAVSILFYSLVDSLETFENAYEKESIKEIDEGDCFYRCFPKTEYETHVSLLFWHTTKALFSIAKEYEEYVHITVIKDGKEIEES